MHESETVQVRRDGAVACVEMRRPEQRNAFTPAMIADLAAAFTALGTATDVRVILLSGAGPAFSAGADVGYMRTVAAAGPTENLADARRLAGLFLAIRDCPKPVVARVHGAAVGGGAGLVAASDIAVAAEGTRFAFPEVRLGILPAVIAPFVLPRIGLGATRELFLTGERFDAARAAAIGLVARVVPEAGLDAAVAERIDALLQGGPEAQAAVKALLPRLTGWDAGLVDLTGRLIAERRASAEGREGLAAFLERRSPAWAPGAGRAA